MKIDKTGIILLCIVLVIYIYTLAPTVAQIDVGELASAQALWGTAHPTGYPLFTLWGYLFVNIPSPFSKVYLSNLLAALWTLGGVFYFYKISLLFLSAFSENNNETNRNSGLLLRVVVPVSVACFAFNKIIWLQSTSVEVYSLHLLLLTGAIYHLLKGYVTKSLTEKNLFQFLSKNSGLFIFIGLAVANHLSIVFFIPGLLLLYFLTNGISYTSLRNITIGGTISGCIAAVFYTIMFFRAGTHPAVNWGDPSTFSNLIFHIRGSQYSEAMFKSLVVTEKNIGAFIFTLPTVYATIPLFFLIPGLFWFKKIPSPVRWFLLLSITLNVFLAINYNIYDLMTYFILAYICLHLIIGWGMMQTGIVLVNKGYKQLYLFLLVSIAFFVAFFNRDVSHRNLYSFEDQTKSILASLPKDAVVFVSMRYDWDFLRSPTIYYQEVEGIRKDVLFVDVGLLSLPWFSKQFSKKNPDLYPPDSSLLAEMQKARLLYLKDNKDSANIGYFANSFNALLLKLIQKTMQKREVFLSRNFIDYEFQYIADSLGGGYYPIPDYYFYRVVKNPQIYRPLSVVREQIRFPEIRSEYVNDIAENAANMLYERATIYEKAFGHEREADSLLQLINYRFPETRLKPKYYIQPNN